VAASVRAARQTRPSARSGTKDICHYRVDGSTFRKGGIRVQLPVVAFHAALGRETGRCFVISVTGCNFLLELLAPMA
jgi:hypothetical protein